MKIITNRILLGCKVKPTLLHSLRGPGKEEGSWMSGHGKDTHSYKRGQDKECCGLSKYLGSTPPPPIEISVD